MFSRDSASFHQLNSDYPLGFFAKYLYFFLNVLAAFAPTRLPMGVIKCKFTPSQDMLSRAVADEKSPISPSRTLSNAFWNSIDWRGLKEIIGNDLKVVEIGCGSGRYGRRLDSLSPLRSYLGIDLFESKDWDKFQQKKFSFVKDSYENFLLHIKDENLIITQSAIEHFDKDLKLFRDIDNYGKSCDYPVVAIHVFPSAFCIFTYLWHGIRQYGFLAIRRLLKSSPTTSVKMLFSLGGVNANKFHLKTITCPSVFHNIPLGEHSSEMYFPEMLTALNGDSNNSSRRFAAFYALVLTWNTRPFDVEKFLKSKE